MSNYLSLLRYGWISTIWSRFVPFLVSAIGPRGAAYLTYLSIDWGRLNNQKAVVCLYRESFIKDIHELRKRTEYDYPIVMAGFTRFQQSWTPKQMQEQTYYQRFESDHEEVLRKSDAYVETLLKLISKKVEIGAVLSANIDYWQDGGFKRVCRSKNIPFVVLSREHPVIPSVCDWVAARYKGAEFVYTGEGVAVAGDSSKRVILGAGVVSDEKLVTVTGLPRFDAWREINVEKRPEERELITLLTFTNGYGADNTFEEVLSSFCMAAESNSHYRFLIKTKDEMDTAYVQKLVKKIQANKVEIDHNESLFEVLPKSRLVVGYNSLSLLEAALAKTNILIPAWGECLEDGETIMYQSSNPNVARCVSFIRDKEDLEALLLNVSDFDGFKWNDEAIAAFIGDFVKIPKEGCSKSFELFMAKFIK